MSSGRQRADSAAAAPYTESFRRYLDSSEYPVALMRAINSLRSCSVVSQTMVYGADVELASNSYSSFGLESEEALDGCLAIARIAGFITYVLGGSLTASQVYKTYQEGEVARQASIESAAKSTVLGTENELKRVELAVNIDSAWRARAISDAEYARLSGQTELAVQKLRSCGIVDVERDTFLKSREVKVATKKMEPAKSRGAKKK